MPVPRDLDAVISGVPLVGVWRANRLESVHAVAACAADATGTVLFALGDVDTPVYLRSAAKPFIAAAGVRRGTVEQFGFDDRELAVMAASHAGEEMHVAAVASVLSKIGASTSDLRCGAHAPYSASAAAALRARGEAPSVLHNNCSGKHAGILALARVLGAPLEGYRERDHPAQREIQALCERVTGEPFDADRWGVDGCGIPVYATSLHNAARSFARFASLDELRADDAAALARIRAAMVAEPDLVSGTGRFDSDLIRAGNGRIVAKGGAEGVHASALLDGAAGLVLKVVDGNARATSPAAVALLRRLRILDDDALAALAVHREPPVRNHAGEAVGRIAVFARDGES